MKTKLLIVTLMTMCGIAFAQQNNASHQCDHCKKAEGQCKIDTVTLASEVNLEVDGQMMPVFLVDGLEMPAWEISNIDTNDIDSIKVIKDDNSGKLMFAPRTNGVILIYTKSKARLKKYMAQTKAKELEKRKNTNGIRLRGN